MSGTTELTRVYDPQSFDAQRDYGLWLADRDAWIRSRREIAFQVELHAGDAS